MPDTEKTLSILLKYGVDEASAGKIAADMRKITGEADKVKRAAEQSRRAWMQMAESGEKLTSIGLRVGAVGAAILGPITLAANQYVKTVGLASEKSRLWIDAQHEIEDSTLRIGKVGAETLLPYMEKAADLAESVAGLIESNPDIIKAAVIGGTVLAGGGAALSTIGVIMNSVGKLGALLGLGKAAAGAAGGAAGAAGAAGGLTALGVGGAALGGVGLGGIVYDFLAKNFGVGGGTRLSQFATVGAFGIGNIFGKGQEWAKSVGMATGAFDQAAEAAERAAAATRKTAQAETDIQAEKGLGSYIAYIKQKSKADKDFERDSQKIASDTGKSLTKLEKDYGAERTKALGDFDRSRLRQLRDFGKTEAASEASYYGERTKRAAQYGVEELRSEEDHQRAMQRLSQSHAKTMRDAIASNDAKAAFEEMQSYEEQRGQAEQDYQVEVQRRSEDRALELSENEAQFKAERAQRLEDFAQQQRDEKEDFDRSQNEKAAQYTAQKQAIVDAGVEQLAALKSGYGDQKTAQRAAFTEQLNSLGIYLGDEKKLRDQYYDDMLRSFKAFMQSGGIVPKTSVGMGDLRAVEREQAAAEMRGGAVSGLSGGSSLNFSPSYTGMGEQDRAWYTSAARQQAEEVLLQFMRASKRNH
jgi:hypothetical protein